MILSIVKEFNAKTQNVNTINVLFHFFSHQIVHRRTTEAVNKKHTKNLITKNEQFGVLYETTAVLR